MFSYARYRLITLAMLI